MVSGEEQLQPVGGGGGVPGGSRLGLGPPAGAVSTPGGEGPTKVRPGPSLMSRLGVLEPGRETELTGSPLGVCCGF